MSLLHGSQRIARKLRDLTRMRIEGVNGVSVRQTEDYKFVIDGAFLATQPRLGDVMYPVFVKPDGGNAGSQTAPCTRTFKGVEWGEQDFSTDRLLFGTGTESGPLAPQHADARTTPIGRVDWFDLTGGTSGYNVGVIMVTTDANGVDTVILWSVGGERPFAEACQ